MTNQKKTRGGDSDGSGPSASEIAKSQMPGWEPVEPSGPIRSFGARVQAGRDDLAANRKVSIDATMPSTEALHNKFFGAGAADAAPVSMPNKPLDDDIEVVEMKSGDLRKSVGVNRKSKKVEWTQG